MLYEVMNMASLWKFPVIYVCENNQYNEYTPNSETTAGEAVVMPYQFRARERSSGSEITAPETWVFWLRDGMIIEVREYRHKAEALEAVGLSE